MDSFAVVGFAFGLAGFITAMQVRKELKELQEKLNNKKDK